MRNSRAVFKGKDKTARFQGITTKVGKRKFEEARQRLASLVKQPVGSISDGDTFEYLARGDADTRAYLKAQADREAQADRKAKHGARTAEAGASR